MNKREVSSKLVAFLLKKTKTSIMVGDPLNNMGDAWRVMAHLPQQIKRVTVHRKEDLYFCALDWNDEKGRTRFAEAWGEDDNEVFCRCLIKALGGDDNEILGQSIK